MFSLTPTGGTAEKVMMLRNPWGTTAYTSDWHKGDARWDAAALAQVPGGINPVNDWNKGYFVVPASKMINGLCLYDYQVAHTRDSAGYKRYWYDAENMDENFHNYFITVGAKDGDLYFNIESYFRNMVPTSCT